MYKHYANNELVYTLLGDDTFTIELASGLGKFSYNVQLLHKINVFEEACK